MSKNRKNIAYIKKIKFCVIFCQRGIVKDHLSHVNAKGNIFTNFVLSAHQKSLSSTMLFCDVELITLSK